MIGYRSMQKIVENVQSSKDQKLLIEKYLTTYQVIILLESKA